MRKPEINDSGNWLGLQYIYIYNIYIYIYIYICSCMFTKLVIKTYFEEVSLKMNLTRNK